jgi:hypothetical protein
LRNKTFFQRIYNNWPAKILSLAAAIVLFLFYRIGTLEERFFSVPIKVITNEQYIPAENYPRKVRITLRGAEEDIFLIMEEGIEVNLDLSEFDNEGEYRVAIEVEKKGAAMQVDPLEIQVEPMQVNITLERKISKSLEVFPDLEGFPEQGYELTQYFLNPTYVTVEGPKSHVSELKAIQTEEIDLTGKKENFTVRVGLEYEDELLNFPGGEYVEFHGVIQEKIIVKSFENVDIIALDLEPEYILADVMPSGIIKVQGTQLLLEKIRTEQIRLTVDCSDIITPGTYNLQVRPDVPLGLVVLSFEPQEVQIQVQEEEEEGEGT